MWLLRVLRLLPLACRRAQSAACGASAHITEAEARQALQLAQHMAYQRWHWDHYARGLDDYLDAALDALVGCLARYRPAGKSFSSYAYRRMWGALKDVRSTSARHAALHQLARAATPTPPGWTLEERGELAQRLRCLPRQAQDYAAGVLAGCTDREIAADGQITPSAMSHRRKKWRQTVVQARRSA